MQDVVLNRRYSVGTNVSPAAIANFGWTHQAMLVRNVKELVCRSCCFFLATGD